jgi:hypothetical protein
LEEEIHTFFLMKAALSRASLAFGSPPMMAKVPIVKTRGRRGSRQVEREIDGKSCDGTGALGARFGFSLPNEGSHLVGEPVAEVARI